MKSQYEYCLSTLHLHFTFVQFLWFLCSECTNLVHEKKNSEKGDMLKM